MKSAEERYLHDPEFKRLVDFMFDCIAKNQYTPTELRDAAIYAAIKFEIQRVVPMWQKP